MSRKHGGRRRPPTNSIQLCPKCQRTSPAVCDLRHSAAPPRFPCYRRFFTPRFTFYRGFLLRCGGSRQFRPPQCISVQGLQASPSRESRRAPRLNPKPETSRAGVNGTELLCERGRITSSSFVLSRLASIVLHVRGCLGPPTATEFSPNHASPPVLAGGGAESCHMREAIVILTRGRGMGDRMRTMGECYSALGDLFVARGGPWFEVP